MKRLSLIIALLMLASPTQAVTVTSHGAGPNPIVVYGEIPQPIEIPVYLDYHLSYDLTLPRFYYGYDYNDPWFVSGMVYTLNDQNHPSPYGQAYLYRLCGLTGCRSNGPDGTIPTFTLTDDYRTIVVDIFRQYFGQTIIDDVQVSFVLPDNLSITAPVPELSTWAMLLLGLAMLGGMRLWRTENE